MALWFNDAAAGAARSNPSTATWHEAFGVDAAAPSADSEAPPARK